MPGCVWTVDIVERAMPKSMTFTAPSWPTMMFDSETSRWTRRSGLPSGSQRRCAWSRPGGGRAHDRRAATSNGIAVLARCAAREDLAEVGAVDVLHREVVHAPSRDVDLEHAGDVRGG